MPAAIYRNGQKSLTSSTIEPVRDDPAARRPCRPRPSLPCLIGIRGILYLAERIHGKQATGFAFVVGELSQIVPRLETVVGSGDATALQISRMADIGLGDSARRGWAHEKSGLNVIEVRYRDACFCCAKE